jgi:hypothetical protein
MQSMQRASPQYQGVDAAKLVPYLGGGGAGVEAPSVAGIGSSLMKTQLAELIEAYAAARVSNNRMLLEYAAGKLNEMLAAIEVAAPKEIADEAVGQGV